MLPWAGAGELLDELPSFGDHLRVVVVILVVRDARSVVGLLGFGSRFAAGQRVGNLERQPPEGLGLECELDLMLAFTQFGTGRAHTDAHAQRKLHRIPVAELARGDFLAVADIDHQLVERDRLFVDLDLGDTRQRCVRETILDLERHATFDIAKTAVGVQTAQDHSRNSHVMFFPRASAVKRVTAPAAL